MVLVLEQLISHEETRCRKLDSHCHCYQHLSPSPPAAACQSELWHFCRATVIFSLAHLHLLFKPVSPFIIYGKWNQIHLIVSDSTKKALTMHLYSCLLLHLTSNAGLGCENGSFWDFESGPIVWLNNAYLIILLLGVGGRGVCKWASRSRWRLRRKLSPSRPSLCIESVPVWLLPQFPPLLNIGPETAVVAAGRVCPRVGSPLLSRFFFFREWVWMSDWITALQGSPPNPTAPDVHTGTGIKGTRGHFWSTWALCLGHLYVWSHLCSDYIRSIFRYQVSPSRKHIKPPPNYHYLPWELTSPF